MSIRHGPVDKALANRQGTSTGTLTTHQHGHVDKTPSHRQGAGTGRIGAPNLRPLSEGCLIPVRSGYRPSGMVIALILSCLL